MRRLYEFLYDLLYTRLAWAYDPVSWIVSLGRWDAWRRAVLPFVQGQRVLEIGFGTGELLPALADGGRTAIGLEPSPAMQQVTAAKLDKPETQALRIPRVQGIGQQLPFADASFDSIVCTFPAPYILDPDLHAECARCLRAGGRLLVVEVALVDAGPLLRLLFRLVFPPAPGAAEKFAAATASAGLKKSDYHIGSGPVRPLVIVSQKPDLPPAE